MEAKNLAVIVGGPEVGIFSFPTMQDVNSFKKTSVTPDGGFILAVGKPEDLAEKANSFLVDLYNRVNPESPVTRFSDRKTAFRRVYEALVSLAKEVTPEEKPGQAVKAPRKPRTPKEKKERGPSYHDKIRAHFADNDTATVEKIMEVTGADERNSRTSMSLIQIPKRAKNPMKFAFHRSSRTYYLLDDGFGRQGQTPVPPEPEPVKKNGKKAAAPEAPAPEFDQGEMAPPVPANPPEVSLGV